LPEDLHLHIVAAAPHAERVEGLMEIADEMHDELQCGSAIGAIELWIFEPLLPIRDAIDDAVAPAVVARSGFRARLFRTVAIAIVTSRIRRDVQVVPIRRLHLLARDGVRPAGNISERLPIEQPRHILRGDRCQPSGRDQSNQPMSLCTPGVQHIK